MDKNSKRIAIVLLFCAFLGLASQANAADCGGTTTCACGNTVTSDYNLTADLTCTGHGLVVGANGITIDGNNHTITGDGGYSDYGINNPSGYDNITIQNFANITKFWIGINLVGCNGSTIQNVTANSNNGSGIYLNDSSTNTLTNNTANSNNESGIYLNDSSTNTLTNNTVNSNNESGIYLNSCPSNNTLTGNTANSNNTAGIYLLSSSSNTLTGNTANSNIAYGIYLNDSSTNTLTNNTANSNTNGIYLYGSSTNTLTNNTANSNTNGIYLNSCPSNNTLTGNTANSNYYGIYYLYDSSSNELTGNIISNNLYDIYNTGTTNAYSSNQFSHNITSKMLTFTEITRTKNVNDTVNFSVSAFNLDGTDCNNCTTITTSPAEAITIDSETGNDITGHFVPTKQGLYSLIFTVTDKTANPNTTTRRMLFFVGDTSSQITKYYLRGVKPTHGQPAGSDSKSLLLTAPTSTETWNCSIWIQNSSDEIPDYPLVNLNSIDTYSWYTQSKESEAYIGVERYVTYGETVDSNSSVPNATNYTWINRNLTDLNWTMDYPQSWYWLSLKLGGVVGSNPHWQTTVAQPSYANFNYQYTTTPAIKSIPDTNIIVLSATAPASDTNNAQIVLDGNGSINIGLANYKRPFLGCITDINFDGNATIIATNLTGVTDLNSVAMDITLSSGDVNVSIDTWNTTGNYYKKWTETGSAAGITAIHLIGNLKANTYYSVKVNSTIFNTNQSNGSGQITFDYNGGYSSKTFEVTEDTTAPTTIDNDYNNSWNNKDQNIQFSCSDAGAGCKNFYYSLDDVNYQKTWSTDTNIGIYLSTDANHKIFYWSGDNADNNESAHLIYLAVDKTNPGNPIISSGNRTTGTGYALAYSAVDAASGIKKYFVLEQGGSYIDNGLNTEHAFSISNSETLPASHTFCVKATDNADNNSNEECINVAFEAASSGITPAQTAGERPPTKPIVIETRQVLLLEKEFTPLAERDLPVLDITEKELDLMIKRIATEEDVRFSRMLKVQELLGADGLLGYRAEITVFIENIAGKQLPKVELIEEIPTEMTKNASSIESDSNFLIIKTGLILKFFVGDLKPGKTTIKYWFERNKEQGPVTEQMFEKMQIPLALIKLEKGDSCMGAYCNDSNPCTKDYCEKGECKFITMNDGTKCGENMECSKGKCVKTEEKTPLAQLPATSPPTAITTIEILAAALIISISLTIIAGIALHLRKKK